MIVKDDAMSTGCWQIKPSELKRVIASILSTGLHVRSVEMSANGTIKIDVTESKPSATETLETSEQLRKLL
jgi:hypothetical protein